MTAQENATTEVNQPTDTCDANQDVSKILAVENNRSKNYAMIIILSTVCLAVIMFVLGVVINMVKYNNPIDGGILETTITPLLEIVKVIVGV